MEASAIRVLHCQHGKTTEEINIGDMLSVFEQLGVFLPPGP